MTDFKVDINTKIFQNATRKLRLRFPVAEISTKTGYAKGGISDFLNNKKPVSDEFLKKFADAYNIKLDDYKDFEDQKVVEPKESTRQIPFYEDAIVMGGNCDTVHMAGVTVHNEMIDAGDWFRDATGAMRVHGNSMFPNYPSGSIIAFKEVKDIQLLLFGQDYMIETSEYRVIKRVQKSQSENTICLCSYNDEKDGRGGYVHENFDVPLKKITRIFRVLGKVERTESIRMVYNETN
jgi:phage repressor protein C with HTH and peptisase S24 domain